jgi:transcriptional regulator with PAS, ATPase and Fis domain
MQAQFEYRDLIRLTVAVIGGILLLIGFIKGLVWVWNTFGQPLRDRWNMMPWISKRVAFLEFKQQWMIEYNAKAIFILDDKKRCIFVNDMCANILRTDSSDILGRKWYGFIKESTLTSTLNKWDEAYNHQSPYKNISVLIVDGKEVTFLVHAEPFIHKGKVHNFIGTLAPYIPYHESKPLES